MADTSPGVSTGFGTRLTEKGAQRIDRCTDLSCLFELNWQSEFATHKDCFFQQRLNLWKDTFPSEVGALIAGRQVGMSTTVDFEPGRLAPLYQKQQAFKVPHQLFRQNSAASGINEAQAGRFYPKRFIAGKTVIDRQDITPIRVTGIGTQLDVDSNHPLSRFDLSLTTSVVEISSSRRQDGSSYDIAELVSTNGPGMQARYNDLPTDFWTGHPFERADERADMEFYRNPRMVNHIDKIASGQVCDLYHSLLGEGNVVLDLMASWNSHLPDQTRLSEMVGLGLNDEELDNNMALDTYVVQDLNENPLLPFDNEKFDAVICTASVEYLTRPMDVFAQVYRVLKPGGRFIITFSNRWFPPKAIKVWTHLHDFERMGLILEYFILNKGFTDLHTWSIRGLPRPADDKYAERFSHSDPVYAVWGSRDGTSTTPAG